MAVHYRTQGFILKKHNLSEADQIFTVFSRDFGKIEILAKAIRKLKSKLRQSADIFYLSELEFIQGRFYKTLTDAVLIEDFKNIREELEKWHFAARLAYVLDNLITGQEQDEKIWRLSDRFFEMLNRLSLGAARAQLCYYYFLWNLFEILGYKIDLYKCAVCQNTLEPSELYFNREEGGIIDSGCFERLQKGIKISPEAVKVLRIFREKDENFILRLKLSADCLQMLRAISEKEMAVWQKPLLI